MNSTKITKKKDLKRVKHKYLMDLTRGSYYKIFNSLSAREQEYLTAKVVHKKTINELAKEWNVTPASVSQNKRILTLKGIVDQNSPYGKIAFTLPMFGNFIKAISNKGNAYYQYNIANLY